LYCIGYCIVLCCCDATIRDEIKTVIISWGSLLFGAAAECKRSVCMITCNPV